MRLHFRRGCLVLAIAVSLPAMVRASDAPGIPSTTAARAGDARAADAPGGEPAASDTIQGAFTPGGHASAISLDDAVRRALTQASEYSQARYGEESAAQDVRQAKAAFKPRISTPIVVTHDTPSGGTPAAGGSASGSTASFIGANAITEYQASVAFAGEIDVAGRLGAILRQNRALLAAAHQGTEVARRALVQATSEAYYGLSLAAARVKAAQQGLAAASDFERITQLLLDAGEVARADLVRARLQTAQRKDELAQARAACVEASGSLRVLIGADPGASVATTDLTSTTPAAGEVDRFTADLVARRPELAQIDALRQAARHESRAARAERRPQLAYSVQGGFDTDSLGSPDLADHTGVLSTVSLTVPLVDWGVSKSRERQARLKALTAADQHTLALRRLAEEFTATRARALGAADRIAILSRSVQDGEDNVHTSIAIYRGGEAPITLVTDAQTTLIAQRAALYQALYEYRVALASLEIAAGLR